MVQIILATTFVVGMYLSMNGIVYGTYVIFALIAIHIATIVFTSIVLIATANLKTDEITTTHESNRKSIDRFMMQIFIGLAGYHLFTIGYVLFTGILIPALTIAFFGNMLHAAMESQETKQ